MKDDSLDDTVNYSMYGGMQTPKPDAIKALAQSKTDINKLGRVDTDRINSVYHKEVWNAAIEAALTVAIKERHNAEMSDEIRKLKK